MKSIKNFKYINTDAFKKFLSARGYRIKNVSGFSYIGQKQYSGNILKVYSIHFNNSEFGYFKVVYFKNFNECNNARFSFSCIKLSGWYSSANVIKYKTNNDGWYVITD